MQNTLTKLKTLNGYAAHARFLAETADDVLGGIPRQIHEPYRFGPDHQVLDYNGTPIIIAETKHRTYTVFRVEGPIFTYDQISGQLTTTVAR